MAAAIALEIDSLLIRDKFEWGSYLKGKQKPPEKVWNWLEKFEAHHWEHVQKTPTTLNSWHKDYELKFNHLPKDEALTLDLLKRLILERTQPETCSRQGYAMAFRCFAEFAKLPNVSDLKELEKGCSASTSVNPQK